jgi:hypothetical protein
LLVVISINYHKLEGVAQSATPSNYKVLPFTLKRFY